ncbi:MAG: hypothetical protein ACREQ5_09355 [Candidatus Dormibacteria bacterium]
MTVAQANPAIQTVGRQLPQTTNKPGSLMVPFIRASKKLQTFGYAANIATNNTSNFTPTVSLGPVAGFLRGLLLKVSVTGGAGTGATYQPDAPFSYVQSLIVRDINNTTIYQVSGLELYLINIYSGQVANGGSQNPALRPSFSAGTGAGNFTFSLVVPFELNRTGYCSLAAASAASPIQVQVVFASLAASGAVMNAAPSAVTGQTVQFNINQIYWSLVQNDIEIAPPDLGATCQWGSAAAGQNPGANANTLVQSPQTLSGWVTTQIITMRDSTSSGAGPARVGALPATDQTYRLDGVDLYSKQLYTEMQDKLYSNFGIVTGVDSPQPLAAGSGVGSSAQLTKGIAVFTWRDDVTEEVNAADTFDELLHIAPGTVIQYGGTFGSGGTPPYTLTFTTGILVPTGQASGLPYTHLQQ